MKKNLSTAKQLILYNLSTKQDYLDIGNCGIKDLMDVPELFKCTHLETLILSNVWWDPKVRNQVDSKNKGPENKLKALPAELRELKNLKTLVVGSPYQKRDSISNANVISEFTKLETLILNGHRIKDINFLLNLPNLKNLDLDYNEITDLSSISTLVKLEYLSIQSNPFDFISSLNNLKSLKILFLGMNDVKNWEVLSNLKKLESLYLHSCRISDIGFIAYLDKLQDLVLGDNRISNISPLSNLTKLKTLQLNQNSISDISDLANLKKLEFLDVSSNQIRMVPESIFQLNMTPYWRDFVPDGLRLYDNPIESPPTEIISQGKKSILEYFRLLKQEGGSENIYEAKLTLVGEGGAGKSSLQIRILNDKAQLPDAETRTRGVEITDWDISNTPTRKEIVHIWDFGGQDMYFPVHRFFLTESCIYVLMASSRNKNHNFEYWIPSIYQFGGDSPIIIGQTCHNGYHEPWLGDLRPFLEKSEFRIVRMTKDNYFKVNLPNDNEGLEELKEAIVFQFKQLFAHGKPVPPSFIKLRNELLHLMNSEPCIAYENYVEFCENFDDTFKNDATLKLFTNTMHEIGALLWYAKTPELKNWIILKPEWAMKAVYALIDDKEIEDHNGHIAIADFERLWSHNTYKHRHVVIKKMLEVFKIAFPKKHIADAYILPARQLNIPAESKWPLIGDNLRVWVKFTFMPKGIINQTSADLSKLIVNDSNVWNNGCILTDQMHDSECLMVEDMFEKKINIVAKGKDARALIVTVLTSIKNIISDYRGVTYDIEVPCRCSECAITEKPLTTYKYSTLLKWSENPKKILRCNESEEEYTVEELLRSVGLEQQKKGQKKSTKSNPVQKIPIVNLTVNLEQNNTQVVKNKLTQKFEIDTTQIQSILSELKDVNKENNKWQTDLSTIEKEIESIKESTDPIDQKKGWGKIKKVWDSLKAAKDTKAIFETVPWIQQKGMELNEFIQNCIDMLA